MTDAEKIIAAAKVLREHGYAIVTQVQADMWDKWLAESHTRERELHDQMTRLCGEYARLLDRVTRLVAPSRPRWLRDTRSWWNRAGYQDPLVFDSKR